MGIQVIIDCSTGEKRIVETREEDRPPPPRVLIDKELVLDRITDAQLSKALQLMTPRQQERWRMPSKPQIYVDDPDLLAVLQAIGADADVVLAP